MAQLIGMLRRGIAEGQTNHNVSMAGVLEQVQSLLTFLTVAAKMIPLRKKQVCCVFHAKDSFVGLNDIICD